MSSLPYILTHNMCCCGQGAAAHRSGAPTPPVRARQTTGGRLTMAFVGKVNERFAESYVSIPGSSTRMHGDSGGCIVRSECM
jgi:hypothetical protein